LQANNKGGSRRDAEQREPPYQQPLTGSPRTPIAAMRPLVNQRAFLDPRLHAVDEYLRAHLSDPNRLSLKEAALIANVSAEHLCRRFHERVGTCFTDWQCAVRTEAAKCLIVQRHVQLRAVGRAVGYSDGSTFGRVFKRYEGVTPRQLRPFVDAYEELAPVVCACTAELVFRIGPLSLRDGESLALLLELVGRLRRESDQTA
jgi:AraC-like DNA-binding protein